MGIIQVRTPSGIKKVRIAGDTPTEAETQAIAQAFSKEMSALRVRQIQQMSKSLLSLLVKSIMTQEFRTPASATPFLRGDNEAEKRARLQFLGVPEEAIQIDQDGEFILDRDLLPEDVKDKVQHQRFWSFGY